MRMTTCPAWGALALFLAACAPPRATGDQDPGSKQTTPTTPAGAAANSAETTTPAIGLSSAQYLVDASGQSVYALEGNAGGTKCDAECEKAWPPVLGHVAPGTVAPGLQPGLLASHPRQDGAAQVGYANQLLYRYAGDGGAGSTSGDGVKDKWGSWHLVSSAGTAMHASSPATGP